MQAHSSNSNGTAEVTKVLRTRAASEITALVATAIFSVLSALAGAEKPPEKPAEALYLQLGQAGLDSARVYKVRGASLDRSAVHISLDDGTIAFTEDVMGRITGAFFEGDGEVLIVPPTDVERKSMSLFTGMAILEEHFTTAYFRFDDDVLGELRPGLRETDEQQAFVDRWQATARNLAPGDAMRLLESLSRLAPAQATLRSDSAAPGDKAADRFFHARLQGRNLGVFDTYYDSLAREQVEVGQAKNADNGIAYYNVWTSFSPPAGGVLGGAQPAKVDKKPQADWITIRDYKITAEVEPPKQIHAHARLQLEVKESKSRVLFLELSRFLEVESVKLAGQPLEFIHNPAVQGTQLARKGDDTMAVILPEPPTAGRRIELDFVYGGEVLAEAGSGLLYVGARGTWYPNRGMAMANFDLQFSYPPGWTLVATGKPVALSAEDAAKPTDGRERSRWVSERPIPFAGFDLGKYKEFKTMAGDVTVETFATAGVERGFPSAPIETLDQKPMRLLPPSVQVIAPPRPSPSRNEESVGESAARAIEYYAARFGPFPYSRLALTQLPGPESQGWPGLVFLSSYAFLNQQEREQLHFDRERIWLQESIPAHETAHQWWGDLVGWDSYRDQWFSEGLANYCALMMLEDRSPAGFRQVMDKYRRDLLEKNKQGVAPMDAGPVTLGVRLLSSRFPDGYEAISYGRATWLFHMLRSMLKDAAQEKGVEAGADEPFVRALHKLRQRFEGKSISTQDLMDAFAEELPAPLRYEGKKSLDWFLEGWVNGTALPQLELKAVKITPKGAASIVSGTIVQKDAPQDLVTAVPVYAVVAGKQVLLGRVFADGEESTFRLQAPAGAHKVVLDPGETLLTAPK